MNLADAMWRGVGGTGPAPTADMPVTDLVRSVIALAGSGAAAARWLGVSHTTIYRWRDGRSQPKMGRQAIVAGIRHALVAMRRPELPSSLGPGRLGLHLHALITASRDTRWRTINLGPYVPARKVRNVVRAWMVGDDARAERLLGRAINTHYAAGAEISDYQSIWFG